MSAYREFRVGRPVVVSSILGIGFGMSSLSSYSPGVRDALTESFAARVMSEAGRVAACAIVGAPALVISLSVGLLLCPYLDERLPAMLY
jgi:hypothetical protein